MEIKRELLLSPDEVITRLQETEPLGVSVLNADQDISFKFETGWEETLDAMHGTDKVDAFITINGSEHQLTKDGAEQLGGFVNVTKKNLRTLPARITQQALDHFYQNMGTKEEFQLLTVKGAAAGVTPKRTTPFSSIQLVESVLEGIEEKFPGANVLADYKFNNSLHSTNVRLIVPEYQHIITGGGVGDVPVRQQDLWSAGIHLSNSLSAKAPTQVESYLFRWWCTNGMTETLGSVGKWNRKTNGQEDDVYDWARQSVDEVLGGMEYRFNQVQKLTEKELSGGNVSDVLRGIFNEYKIPVAQRDVIRENLENADSLNMYTLMSAITQAANDPSLTAARADQLMRVGGAIPSGTSDPERARVWNEGHSSDPEAVNPYALNFED